MRVNIVIYCYYYLLFQTDKMLIHGKLHLTASGLNLDEVRSLLQKSLRRKETDLVLKSCKELIGNTSCLIVWYNSLYYISINIFKVTVKG